MIINYDKKFMGSIPREMLVHLILILKLSHYLYPFLYDAEFRIQNAEFSVELELAVALDF